MRENNHESIILLFVYGRVSLEKTEKEKEIQCFYGLFYFRKFGFQHCACRAHSKPDES